MPLNFFANFLLDVNTKVTLEGTSPAATAAPENVNTVVQATTEAVQQANATEGFFATLASNPLLTIVLYCALIFGIIYFLSIRPQKKNQEKMDKERAGLKVGDTVVLSNGMYGVITDIYVDAFVIEFGTNRAVRVPVAKSQVIAAKSPNLTNRPEEKTEEPEKKGFFARLKG